MLSPGAAEAEGGPSVLCLRKWDPFRFPFKLSDFREAFISPTREILLLLSRENEAVLLPLITGKLNSSTSDDGDGGDSFCSVLSDAKLLAWGHCGDSYSRSKSVSFDELLFMSNEHDIIVHAFCPRNEIDAVAESAPECGIGRGKWVDWGPGLNGRVETGEIGWKRWFRSFLVEVEAREVEGSVGVKFPVVPSFPRLAEVVSFSIRDLILKFLDTSKKDSHRGSISLYQEDTQCLSVKVISDSEMLMDCASDCIGMEYKISRLFSSSSHRLVGIVLTSVEPVLNSMSEESPRCLTKSLVVIVMVCPWGLQWVSSVKIQDEYLTPGGLLGWVDFQFVENFLVGLNSSGATCIWCGMSGEIVACLSVLSGSPLLGPSQSFVTSDLMAVTTQHDSEVGERKVPPECYVYVKRLFRKLIVASNSFLLAVVDEYGIIYVIRVDDYISEKYRHRVKFMLPFQHCGLGVLAGWKIAGSEIGGQKVYAHLSHTGGLNFVSSPRENLGCSDQVGSVEPSMKIRDPYMSGFTSSQVEGHKDPCSGSQSPPMRKVFLPSDKCCEEDYVFFSPLGITRLFKRYNINEEKIFKIVNTPLQLTPSAERDLNTCYELRSESLSKMEHPFVGEGEAVGCSFQGCLYLVSQDDLSIILPSISVANCIHLEAIRYWLPNFVKGGSKYRQFTKESRTVLEPWKIEVLDRTLLYEGPEVAEKIFLENGWDLKIVRMRRLQLALDYLKYDDLEQSLNMLGEVNLAEEGILRMIFTSVYRIFCKVGGDNEVVSGSRFLDIAARFATKMIRRYGLIEHEKHRFILKGTKRLRISYLNSVLPDQNAVKICNLRRLQEMAHFVEIIRKLQHRLTAKFRRPGQRVSDGKDAARLLDTNISRDGGLLPLGTTNSFSSRVQDSLTIQNQGMVLSSPELESERADGLASSHAGSLVTLNSLGSGNLDEFSVSDAQGGIGRKKLILSENPRDMIARWEIDKPDLQTVVKDALHSGRLPLAVLQLHRQQLRDMVTEREPFDTFSEIRDVGRTIAYDLFLKGEVRLAIETLQRLGEDIETSLRQLAFGTVSRSLRANITEEMKRFGYLQPHERKTLERISLIERLYPSSSFWGTLLARRRKLSEVSPTEVFPQEKMMEKTCLHVHENFTIECGEIDGVVIGPWANLGSGLSASVADESTAETGYWACAAVWSDAWDERTMDRIVLDQPLLMGVHIPWESQFEYHVYHNNWEEVSKLLDVIPASLLSNRNLQVNLDVPCSASNDECNKGFPDHAKHIWPTDEIDAVCLNIPNVKILRLSALNVCSAWLRMLVERELATKFIFIKEYWEGTIEIVCLLGRAGLLVGNDLIESTESSPELDFSSISVNHKDTIEAMHKLMIHHCRLYNLPNLLDLYLDHHKLANDMDCLLALQEAAAGSHWVKWLLLSRTKGREYESSFSNARAIASENMVSKSNVSVLEMDDIICSVDDMAEGGGETAALATLMYAPSPIQKCLCSGSVNRNGNASAHCTLENLRPCLQHFPTLWRTFFAACFGQDALGGSLNASAAPDKSAFSDYLAWRASIFSSPGGDTSLVQMLPRWFPKPFQRLINLFVQGPLGWESFADGAAVVHPLLHHDIDVCNSNGNTQRGSISCEASIQKHIEEELYSSSFVDNGFGVEHHLHRGRPLAAFNYLLGARAQRLKKTHIRQETSRTLVHGQVNIQPDVQTLLAPLSQEERSLISSVVPLAITHFVDSAFVASCAFLLELCGISASMLYVDIAALHRISSVFKLFEHDVHHEHASPKGSAFHVLSHDTNEIDFMGSLARILADDYLYHDTINSNGQKDAHLRMPANRHPSRAIITVLRHLEKASLPMIDEGGTCGSWLRNGNGDGAEYRARQKAASQQWCWVTEFCQVHHLPLSTKYLSLLAKDNDWVGFLTEAQIGGFPFDVIFQIASKEFSDPPLKVHILTVLKSIESARRENNPSLSSTSEAKNNESSFLTERNTMIPVELFGLLAECEKQNHPGEALLSKAKDLRWSLLAIIASCYPDVPPLSCLTVWLEISAAREMSAIKVNDIVSQIANNVGAAVDATNALSTGDRTLTLHYNRRNPKRRRLLDPASENSIEGTVHNVADASCSSRILISQESTVDDEAQERVNRTVSNDPDVGLISLSKMIAVLCEQRLFLPLLRAFEMFLPNCALLPLIRAFQAFSQMRLSEAAAHLVSFSARFKEEPYHTNFGTPRDVPIKATWISSTAIKTADAMLSTCSSAYEKRCLLQLLSVVEFGDGGSAAARFGRHYWKINLAEPSLRKDEDSYLGNEILDDAALLNALEKNGQWEQARNWARQLESSGSLWKSCVHHVTTTQAEAMVAEWKEFLWDVPEERAALWSHCQTLFLRYSFPAVQAGLFFLKHAEAVEKDIPSRELHEMLLLSLQWLSGTITQSSPVYPLHLLREIETRVWLLAVESEAQATAEGNFTFANSIQNPAGGSSTSIIEHTANVITRMDNHINTVRARATEKNDTREGYQNPRNLQTFDSSPSATSNSKTKRRAKGYISSRRSLADAVDKKPDLDDYSSSCMLVQEENAKIEASISGWEERVKPAEVERAILSLLDFGQVTAAKQLQNKLSPSNVLPEFALVDTALKLASVSCPSSNGEASVPNMDPDILPIVRSYDILDHDVLSDPLQVLEILATKFNERCGRGLCKRIVAVVKAAKVLGVSFSEAFDKRPIELLQLLSLKAQDSLEEAKILVQTHVMSPASIAQILAEAFLKGLLAAHRGGYMDSQKEEGPAPLLWRFSDFLKWAELCPSEPEIGHALMRLVMTGQEIPHACEVELLILSHHFYKSSACLDGVDVLVALAATKVEAYVSEGDFSCLARLVTGVSNFHALHFILGILIENGQLELLLQKYSATDTTTSSAEAVRGFRMAVLTSLKHFNPHDLDAFAMVYSHFDMKHEMASLLESRSRQSIQQWYLRYNHEQNEDLLEAMRLYIEAAEVHSTIDAGHKTGRACAVASLLSLQIRIPDLSWLDLSETNARRALVEQSNFQEALIVAEAYNLNQPGEWAPVLWNQMLKPEVMERFVAEFVVVLPLQTSMLLELARFYRAEVAARGDQHSFSVWLSPGGLPAEWVKHLGRSFRSLLRRTRDLRVRLQLATLATGFGDVVDACQRALDRVPETAGPLVLRKGHGGAYLPLM